jgi:superfamily II DNA or RNA helicase
MGDYANDELAEVMDKPTITGDAVQHYFKYAPGKRAIVFCVSVQHSRHVAAQFNSAGIAAVHVDGETDFEVRDRAIREFREGSIKILCNVELFGEGFDVPVLEAVILLRPTQSLGLYLQQVGRSLRPCEGKTKAVILDHVGNCQRHGLPDEERVWSLEGHTAQKKSLADSLPIRICPNCMAAQPATVKICKYCGTAFEIQYRTVAEQDGELKEIDPAASRRLRNQEQSKCQSFEDLVELGRKRGYKRPYLWAKYVFNARQARKLQEAYV